MFRFAFSLLIVCTVAEGFQQDTRSPDSDRDKVVYAIYSLMLTNPATSHGPYTSDRYLIAMTTGPGVPQEPCVRPTKEREADFQQVLADYNSRKATPRQLMPEFSISKPYDLLNPDEVKDFISERTPRPSPGATTDERFQGVSDLITLTDVYFNQRGTLALTAISTFCGGLCALYQWKVFEKVSGQWEERQWTTCMTMAGNWEVPAISGNEESAIAR